MWREDGGKVMRDVTVFELPKLTNIQLLNLKFARNLKKTVGSSDSTNAIGDDKQLYILFA